MTRKYRYSNTKFWLLMSACLVLLTLSGVYHAYSLRNYARQVQAEFRLSLSLLLKTTSTAMFSQKHDALQSLADATATQDAPADAFWRFLSHQPLIRAVARYNVQGDQQQFAGTPTPCLSETFAFDGFCEDRGMMAIRLSLPTYTQDGRRDGYLSAVVVIPPRDMQAAEREFGLRLHITAQRAIYSSLAIPRLPDNVQIHPPAMTQHVLSATPSRIWRHGLWFVTTIRLGRQPSDMVVQVAKNANFLVWKGVEALLINGALLIMTVILFSYFHVNYQYISHVYRAVIDGMADWLAFKDLTGTYQIINTTMARGLFDLHPKEVVGKRDSDLLTTDIAQQCTESDQDVLTRQETVHLREAGQTASGRFIVLDVYKTPMFHESGKFGGVVLCARDISEQTQLQATLDALEDSYFSSEWILSKLFQTMPEFIYVKDTQHRFIRASFSICEFYGYADVTGLTDFDLLPPEEAKGFWQDEERLFTGQMEGYTQHESVTLPDGRRRHFLSTKTVFRDKQGKIAGLLGIGRDVTEMMDKQTAFEFVIAQMTQQTLQQVEKRKQKTEKFQIEESHV